MSGSNRSSIVFINHWAKSLGGAEHSLLDIMEYMARKHACHLVVSEDGELVQRATNLGVTCHIIPCRMKQYENLRKRIIFWLVSSLPSVFAYCHFVLQVRNCVVKISPHVIHANVPKSHIALCLLYLLGYKGSGVFHIREIFSKGSAPLFAYTMLFPNKGAKIIAISEAVKNGLPLRMKKKSTVLYNGVTIYDLSQKKTSLQHSIHFLYLGRIVPWKGCHLLLDYFSEVIAQKGNNTNVHLTLVGDTIYWTQEYRNELLTSIQKKGISAHCRILPQTNNVEQVLHNHNVFVNASESEPFGRSLAEAQGAGLPVIAFDSGGVHEIVENNCTGILVPQNNGNAFVKAMIRYIEDPSLVSEMGKEAHRRATLLFNKERQMQQIGIFITSSKDCLSNHVA